MPERIVYSNNILHSERKTAAKQCANNVYRQNMIDCILELHEKLQQNRKNNNPLVYIDCYTHLNGNSTLISLGRRSKFLLVIVFLAWVTLS